MRPAVGQKLKSNLEMSLYFRAFASLGSGRCAMSSIPAPVLVNDRSLGRG